ncbi:hypothetical protein [Streptomyces sp. NPDC051572]|uniref:hypothetical protein n=1 Tax=Streptomyces sp. NPDC051572 TaxID=3155802 RepID=UPI00344D636E
MLTPITPSDAPSLDAIDAAPLGATVTVLGETFTLPQTSRQADGRPGHVWDAHGSRRHLRAEEKQAFFAWAIIEILRHTVSATGGNCSTAADSAECCGHIIKDRILAAR